MLKILKRIGRISLFVLLFILIVNFIPPTDAIALNSFTKGTETLLIASQSGCGDTSPQNTMIAFNRASSYGVMYFSFGIVLSADEKMIVADTDDLSVYTESNGKISDQTYEELTRLNFAYQYQDEQGDYPYRLQSVRCVTLEELFEHFPYSNFIIKITMSGDAGERTAILACELLRKYDLSTRAVVTGDEQITEYVRNQTNVHVLTAPIKNEFLTYKSFQKILLGNLYTNIDFQYVQISTDEINNFTHRLVRSLQNRNICVFLSDVNNEENYRTAIELGVDGVITDVPELIGELLATDAELIPEE